MKIYKITEAREEEGVMDDFRNIVNANKEIRRLESQLAAAVERERMSNEAIADWHRLADLRSEEIVRLKERERVLEDELTHYKKSKED